MRQKSLTLALPTTSNHCARAANPSMHRGRWWHLPCASRRDEREAGMNHFNCAHTRSNTRQKAASCVVVKLMRISVPGWRLAWNSEPGASR